MLPHGGPEFQDDASFDYVAQFLASRGYAVLQPQFRGSTGFGVAHRKAGYRQWGKLMQDDVTDGVRAMIDQGIADPKRVCIAGMSYGGYSALAGAAFTPELYACAISVNGLSDLPNMLGYQRRVGGDESDRVAYWKEHIGPANDPDVIARSPARAARNVRAPVLLIHGIDDSIVPVAQSQGMMRALGSVPPHELIELSGEDHWLSRSATRIRVLTEMERFLAKHLPVTGQAAD
jgi:dipeptidyl aminopeptidase/acylaminoacyl peptidase